ncbi:DinB family protein [Chitinophaga sp. 30R24]|uniref:DinB family protein n=1 Tax=Chitinophaga sp. 30R24 TaxID=3248838 RepID=UPI003B90AEA7
MYLNQHEIKSLLNKSFDDFIDFVNMLPDIRFTASPYGKWSAGQQLDHLTKSIKPVSSALGYPKLTLLYFGTSNTPSRTYEQLVTDYQDVLDNGGKTSRAYQPGVIYPTQRPALIQSFLTQKMKLNNRLSKWSEKDLDKYRLPHPMLGKITVREMMYYLAHHNQHHLAKIQDQELKGHTWQNQLQQLIF